MNNIFLFYQKGQFGENKYVKGCSFFLYPMSRKCLFAITFKHSFIVSHNQKISLFLANVLETSLLQYLTSVCFEVNFVCDETRWFCEAQS